MQNALIITALFTIGVSLWSIKDLVRKFKNTANRWK